MMIIVATDKNNAIGVNGKLPWHFTKDLKYFKEMTIGGTVVMGRKTWESIGKPLFGRENVVISRLVNKLEGATVFKDIESCVELLSNSENVFIIGGEQIYREFLNLVDTLYITEIGIEIENADAYFPKIDLNNWDLISTKEEIENDCKLVFKKYIRKY